MQNNQLFNLYSNLCVYFMKQGNFREAKQVVNDMENLGVMNTLLLFRKAQVIAANAESTV